MFPDIEPSTLRSSMEHCHFDINQILEFLVLDEEYEVSEPKNLVSGFVIIGITRISDDGVGSYWFRI